MVMHSQLFVAFDKKKITNTLG